MRNKIPVMVAAVMLLSTFGLKTPSISAKMEKDGVTYWSIAEMAEFKKIIDAEVKEKCHGDIRCEDEAKYNYYRQGGQYRALEVADMVGGFMVTNINPALETITIRYTDYQEQWFRRNGFERDFHEEIISLYMVWVDEGVGDPAVDTRYMYNYADRLKAGEEIPGVHVILAKNNEKDGVGWLPEGEEVEFSIAGSDILSLNSTNRIHHKLGGNIGMSISIGTTYLSECLDSPDYEVGMDCKLMIGDDGSYSYKPVPVVVQQEIQNATESSKKNIENEEKTEDAPDIAEVEEVVPLAPDTGYKACETKIEFPWWLVVSLIIADFLVMWWLIPEKSQKNQKNMKKGVDKSKPV